MEEEINLRAYIEILLRRWRWIVGLTLAAVAVALLVSVVQAPVFQAKASLIVRRIRTEATFVPEIKTQEEEWTRRADLDLYLQSLVELAGSASVATAVFEQVKGDVDGGVATLAELQEMVSVTSKAGLIFITVRARNPQLAASVANTWAQEAMEQINAVYGPAIDETQLSEMRASLGESHATYLNAQAELESFLAQGHVSALTHEIEHRQDLITRDQQALVASEAAAYSTILQSNRQALSDDYARLVEIGRILDDARALQQEIDQPASTAGVEWARTLAFVELQRRAFGGLPGEVQVVMSEEAPLVRPQDVERLIHILEKNVLDRQAAIAQRESSLLAVEPTTAQVGTDNPLKARIEATDREIQALKSELEAEDARQRELSEARDLAWETYQTIARKVDEAEFSAQISGSELRIASQALPPVRPQRSRLLLYTAVAAALGLAVSVFGILAIGYWQGETINPLADRREQAKDA